MNDDLLIVEDLMLLLLSEDGGYIAGAGTLQYQLAGAVLLELAQNNRLEIHFHSRLLGTMIRVRRSALDLESEEILRTVLESMGTKEHTAYDLVASVGATLKDPVLARLMSRGIIDSRSKKILGLIPTTTWPEKDSRPESRIRSSIIDVVETHREPDPRTAAIIALLSAGQVYVQLRPQLPWNTMAARRVQAIEKSAWDTPGVAAEVKEICAEVTNAVRTLTTSAASVTLP